jgi:subtilisin-like proprotein convertase family protein/subtilisin family serine protease
MISVQRFLPNPLALFLAVVLLASGSALADKSSIADQLPSPSDGRVGSVDSGVQIRLAHGHYDPAYNLPPLPPALVSHDRESEGTAYYLVQFDGPIRQSRRNQLAATGATIMDYVPDFAFIVRMDGQTSRNVRSIDGVRWMGIYEPGFRLSTDLIAQARKSGPAAEPIDLIVRAFRDEPIRNVAQQLTGRGVLVQNEYADSGGGAIFRVSAYPDQLFDLAGITALAWIERELEPALANSVARSDTIVRKEIVENTIGLFGAGQVVAIGDSGLDTGDPVTVHEDFSGRVIGGTWGPGNCGTWADGDSHGTHVAGSAAGSGALSGANIAGQDYSGSHAGLAPEADLYIWSFCNNFSGLPNAPYADYYGAKYAVNPQLRVSNNSWGYTSNQGQYNTFTRETDRFVFDHPDMVLVYAAGNAGTDGNSDGVVDLFSMNMPSTAKNVVTVGASENLRDTGGLNPGGACSTWGGCWSGDYPANPVNSDRLSDDEFGLAAFSGRGPTLSDRIKPDIVAPGTNIVSARNYSTGTGWGVYNADYLYMGGTSMASPLVAGASAVVREFYQTIHAVPTPSAALVKATLVNGAVDMTPGQYGDGATQEILRRPDNRQGFGRVNLEDSLVYVDDRQLYFHEHAGLITDDTFQLMIDAGAEGAPFRATLAWTDREGTEAGHGALVNDLDLEVLTPGGLLHRGNETHTGGSADRNNNVEVVELPGEEGIYTVTVRGFNIPQGPQPFALVVSYQEDKPYGQLQGLVESGESPLEGATITADGPVSSTGFSNIDGQYSMALDPGTYVVTASRFGYVSQTVNSVQIDEDMIELLDFDLTTASVILLEGVVSDAQTGWALYARIDVAGDPNGPYWTDPESGAYSFVVPTDTVIPLTVTSLVPGYIADSLNIGPLVSNTEVDVELIADATSCTAPGYEPGAPLSDGIESFHNDVRGIASCLPPVSGGLIVGQISDMSGDGINGAMVDHEDGPVAQTADLGGPDGEGFYVMFSPAGTWQLEASAQSYIAESTTVNVNTGETARQDFVLDEPGPPVLNEYCTEVNLAIPDNNSVGVDSFLSVPDNGNVAVVSAYVRGEHTWVGDLRVRLTHPDGETSVLMIDRPGRPQTTFGCDRGDFDVRLDDLGTDGPVENQCFEPPALRGRATPNEPMSAFYWLNAQGDWALNISDNAGGDTGTLNEWCLEIGLPTFHIGGTVSGLSGSGLVLQNNGGDDLSIGTNGSFRFATTLLDTAAYNVTVLTDPTSPNQTCSVTNGSNNLNSGNVTDVTVDCVTDQFTVGGNISGLAGTGLVLQNNGGDDLPITADGSFTFVTALDDLSDYLVTVLTDPSGPSQTCTVSNEAGTVEGVNVTNVQVSCMTNQFTIGGSVTGLVGSGLVLQNNGGDDLPITADGSFDFSTALDDGSGYEVAVLTNPVDPEQRCRVLNGTGTLSGDDVTDAVIECLDDDLFHDRYEMTAPL